MVLAVGESLIEDENGKELVIDDVLQMSPDSEAYQATLKQL